MAFVITDACVGCKHTACTDGCPTDCIHPTRDEAGFDAARQLYIDPDACIDCGLCASECPETAIFQDSDLPEGKESYIQINAAHYAIGAA